MERREFLKDSLTASLALGAIAGLEEANAQTAAPAAKKKDDELIPGAPVKFGIIGTGPQGREIMASLAKIKEGKAQVVSYCDTYKAPALQKKAAAIAPAATFTEDYRRILEDKTIQAVFVATPSHLHRQIVLDALAAGKHVYCEMPLATDLSEARVIAQAGLKAKTIFMPGLQVRSNKQHEHVLKFVRSGALGKLVSSRAQHHVRNSWRQAHPDAAREKELNWRLVRSTSSGLIGEIGIHQIDTATWFTKTLPLSVAGVSSLLGYKDGRDVPDTVSCVLQYPNDVSFSYDATLVNSFDGAYEEFLGSNCAIQLRDQRAWMFKETDSSLLGWEVYARKDEMQIGSPEKGSGLKLGTGIALVADATKQLSQGVQPGSVGTDVTKTALYQACWNFTNAIATGKKLDVTAVEGYHATVIANKANEAVLTGVKIVFDPKWFEI